MTDARGLCMVGIHRLGMCACLAIFFAFGVLRVADAGQRQDRTARAILAAIRGGDLATVRDLLGRGADVNAPDESGATALLLATLNADIGMMQLLLHHGANANMATKDRATALLWALHDPAKVKLLLDHGAKVPDDAIFASAAMPRGARVLRLLAEAGAELDLSKNGYTTLMAASRSGSIDTVRLLIAEGADARAKNKIGFTALYGTAFWPDSRPIIRLLLANGADASARVELAQPATDVFTALMGASMRGDSEAARASWTMGQIAACKGANLVAQPCLWPRLREAKRQSNRLSLDNPACRRLLVRPDTKLPSATLREHTIPSWQVAVHLIRSHLLGEHGACPGQGPGPVTPGQVMVWHSFGPCVQSIAGCLRSYPCTAAWHPRA